LGGVALAILFGMLFGAMPLLTEFTPEISARLTPNLLDLLVAVFAGLAGTWAVVDERISPVLPGVAISTAIIPPLAVCGICVGQGAYVGAKGSFLLFFANFLAVLLVSSFIFWRAGLGKKSARQSSRQLAPPILVTAICLLIVAIFLTQALLRVVELRHRTGIIRQVLQESEGTYPLFSVIGVDDHQYGDTVYVLAKLNTSKALSPSKVAMWQDRMSQRMNKDVDLTVNCNISHDVSSRICSSGAVTVGLDGISLTSPVHPHVCLVRVAEQTLRQAFKDVPDVWLQEVDLVNLSGKTVILASLESHRVFLPGEVELMEKAIKRESGEKNFQLVLRCQLPYDVTSKGRILLGDSHFAPDTEEKLEIRDLIRKSVEQLGNLYVDDLDGVRRKSHWDFYVEVVGDRLIRPAEVKEIERRVSDTIHTPTRIVARTRAELTATGGRYLTRRKFIEQEKDKISYGRIEKNLRSLSEQKPEKR
jgi:uncharacterized protein DUF389